MPDPSHRMREFSDDELKLIAGLTYNGAIQMRLSEEALIEVGRRIELDAQIDAQDAPVPGGRG